MSARMGRIQLPAMVRGMVGSSSRKYQSIGEWQSSWQPGNIIHQLFLLEQDTKAPAKRKGCSRRCAGCCWILCGGYPWMLQMPTRGAVNPSTPSSLGLRNLQIPSSGTLRMPMSAPTDAALSFGRGLRTRVSTRVHTFEIER